MFKGRVGKGRGAPSANSPDFVTLVALQKANEQLLGKLGARIGPVAEKKRTAWAIDYWNRLAGLVEPWSDIANGDTAPQDARREYISSSPLVLWALGAVGNAVSKSAKRANENWADTLAGLAEIDWRKSNPDWQGICMAEHEVVTRVPTLRATTNWQRPTFCGKSDLAKNGPSLSYLKPGWATPPHAAKLYKKNQDSEADEMVRDYDQERKTPRLDAFHAPRGLYSRR